MNKIIWCGDREVCIFSICVKVDIVICFCNGILVGGDRRFLKVC